MNSPQSAAFRESFTGAASITLRFAGFEQYQQAVQLYRAALGHADPSAPPAAPPSYSIPISDSMELLCAWQSPALKTDCTIVYWAVGKLPEEIAAACRSLEAKGYRMREAPGESPLGSGDKPDTQRAVLEDESGHLMGLIINPPVPLMTPTLVFQISPTHVINPPVTVGESNNEGS